MSLENISSGFIPLEQNIDLAKSELKKAQEKYNGTKSVIDKINLEEAALRVELLEKDISGGAKEKEQDIDLDFTKKGAIPGLEVKEDTSDPETKLAQAKKGIDIATRGLEYANKIGDQDMVDLMKRKLEEYEGTVAMLEPAEKTAEASNDSDFDQALYATGEGHIADKLEARRKVA